MITNGTRPVLERQRRSTYILLTSIMELSLKSMSFIFAVSTDQPIRDRRLETKVERTFDLNRSKFRHNGSDQCNH